MGKFSLRLSHSALGSIIGFWMILLDSILPKHTKRPPLHMLKSLLLKGHGRKRQPVVRRNDEYLARRLSTDSRPEEPFLGKC
ncbi:hypothetical protein PVK06_002479 [Gossypium arboreum]|uniref:Uncharacterized protein n=1 Tax=Gossypium arboreum TaxID=29729 RepID=A0ABR0R3S4_GOSAR|nr:hypothetical protein PVK06_002479 [Gossypium arboreum]